MVSENPTVWRPLASVWLCSGALEGPYKLVKVDEGFKFFLPRCLCFSTAGEKNHGQSDLVPCDRVRGAWPGNYLGQILTVAMGRLFPHIIAASSVGKVANQSVLHKQNEQNPMFVMLGMLLNGSGGTDASNQQLALSNDEFEKPWKNCQPTGSIGGGLQSAAFM